MIKASDIAKLGCCLLAVISFCLPAVSADEFRLAPGISYHGDRGAVFPIVASSMNDTKIESGKQTLIFFGAVGDLNTNRQAKRVVDLYKKECFRTKFIVIDVDNPANSDARHLIESYYPGYVPSELLLDCSGHVAWSEVGEVSGRHLHLHVNGGR